MCSILKKAKWLSTLLNISIMLSPATELIVWIYSKWDRKNLTDWLEGWSEQLRNLETTDVWKAFGTPAMHT